MEWIHPQGGTMMCPLVPVSCIPRAVLLYFSFSSARTLADLKEKKKTGFE